MIDSVILVRLNLPAFRCSGINIIPKLRYKIEDGHLEVFGIIFLEIHDCEL
ncbi:MAG: hypothetical protein HY912_20535 [Desulfomonile tiedjei]|uniref:Uncharacterized protein n=1 Tax=Desulfomonile tiedjei TaxID=2358 RepID=A0A9D6V4F1_9BACT|nr:hypothetical protein [Desulfomonile tiedjei]